MKLENNCVCDFCGKEYHKRPSQMHKTNYCSRKCFTEAKKIYMKGEGNHQYGLKGELNASWKSDKKISKYGYMQVRCPNHPLKPKDEMMFEHRLIAEKYLLNDENSVEIDGKRYLKKTYTVHHKNGDRLDNRVENLEVMPKCEHSRLHSSMLTLNKDELTGRFLPKNRNFPIVKFLKGTGGAVPKKAYKTDAGWDIRTPIKFEILPRSSYVVRTKTHVQMPIGYAGFIESKSGLNVKHNVITTGLVDANYNGEIVVKMFNLGDETVEFDVGDKISQLVVLRIPEIELIQVDNFDETERGENGFGSTGK